MKELAVLSGKGGTGKTSLTAAFAALAENKVLADCDVDAADLHLLLNPEIRRREPFRAGGKAVIRQEACAACGACLAWCRFEAVRMDGTGAGEATFTVDPFSCEGCGVCVRFCPEKAIDFVKEPCGEWYVSDTNRGPMVHAALEPAEENSGKLVALVRTRAKEIAAEQGRALVLVDGPPGIGCPAIAAVTGVDLVLLVTEPSLSARHDLERIHGLAKHFAVPVAVCINKSDVNPEIAGRIEAWCRDKGVRVVGRLPYDTAFVEAQLAGKSIVEFSDGPLTAAVKEVWAATVELLGNGKGGKA